MLSELEQRQSIHINELNTQLTECKAAMAHAHAALLQMFNACNEWAAEFTQKTRAMNWGVVNEAYMAARASMAELEKLK